MTNHPELQPAVITVMTCRDPQQILGVMQAAASEGPCPLPPGVGDVDDLIALMRSGVAFFVAYIAGEPAGVLGYRWERSALGIVHVAVKAAYQRLGVARRLVQAVEAVGFALGTTTVSLEVSPDGMHLPFERLGYVPAETTNGASDRIHMRKDLLEYAR